MMLGRALVCCLAVVVAVPAAAAAGAPPRVGQLVVFRDGSVKEKSVRAKRVTVRVTGHSCALPAATPLAALAASRVAPIGFRDFGSCSRRTRDAGGLFVRSIGRDVNAGEDGWVYKVGRRLGTAGAADPTGAFGRGLLKPRAQVLWFYCHFQSGSCQRTLSLTRVATGAPGQVTVSVRAYNDQGRGVPAAGATVRVGSATAITGADGRATVTATAGAHRIHADQAGRIRSFTTRVVVR
jgi:hypothetical protein